MSTSVFNNIESIRSRITNAALRVGRKPEEIELIAVSKRVPISVMGEAVQCGQMVFGESYVQEALSKRKELKPEVKLVMIGHLQRNKVKQAVACFDSIHSVDSLALAEKISFAAIEKGKCQNILVQVNISGETQKSGVLPDKTEELCSSILSLKGLNLQGLMIIGQWMPEGVNESQRREEFRKTRELRDVVAGSLNYKLPQLSMGMSSDFELAVEEGATMVRVGTSLFGERA